MRACIALRENTKLVTHSLHGSVIVHGRHYDIALDEGQPIGRKQAIRSFRLWPISACREGLKTTQIGHRSSRMLRPGMHGEPWLAQYDTNARGCFEKSTPGGHVCDLA